MWKTLAALSLAALSAAALSLALVGCGGKVVVDDGAGSTSTGTSTSTDCVDTCTGTSPTCACAATCTGQLFAVACSGGSCDCFENSVKVGVCDDDGTCAVTSSCCADLFFGGG